MPNLDIQHADLYYICPACLGGEDNENCFRCDGYGHCLTDNGQVLLDFLAMRGLSIRLSPRAEYELQGMLE